MSTSKEGSGLADADEDIGQQSLPETISVPTPTPATSVSTSTVADGLSTTTENTVRSVLSPFLCCFETTVEYTYKLMAQFLRVQVLFRLFCSELIIAYQ